MTELVEKGKHAAKHGRGRLTLKPEQVRLRFSREVKEALARLAPNNGPYSGENDSFQHPSPQIKAHRALRHYLDHNEPMEIRDALRMMAEIGMREGPWEAKQEPYFKYLLEQIAAQDGLTLVTRGRQRSR